MLLIEKVKGNLHRLMALPAILLFSVFFIIPFAQGLQLSFTNWDGFSRTYEYIGFQNFKQFFSDERALNALKITTLFGLLSPLLMCVFGFFYSLLLDTKLIGRNVVRTIVYLPVIISPLIMGYVWLIVLSPNDGAIVTILQSLGLESLFRDWLGHPEQAIWAIIAINLWQYVGGTMIIFLAGLQSIPGEVYEAAKIDGAKFWSTLRYVTLPLLLPSIRINLITNMINSLAVFEVILALTNGGPGYATESLSMYIYRSSFDGHTAYATAVAIIMFVVVLIPVGIALRLMNKKDFD